MSALRGMPPSLSRAFSQDFYGVLRSCLDAAGLLLHGVEYAMLREKAINRGLSLWATLRRTIGERNWQSAQNALPRQLTDPECGRVLGFGAALTSFAISPIIPQSDYAMKVTVLGALTNFIVGIYDTHLDSASSEQPLLERSKLVRLLAGFTKRTSFWSGFFSSPQESVFSMLVCEFTRQLKDLTPNGVQTPAICDIMSTVVAMYDAQHACNRLRLNVPTRDLKNKGALSMVVMGAPAWLVASETEQQQITRHRKWLYQLGDFLALIDDSVDLYLDVVSGEPNRIERILHRHPLTPNVRTIAQAIASRGAKVLDEWQGCHIGDRESQSDHEVLAMVVTSWIEGRTEATDPAVVCGQG
jgi:hypothetical protein